MRELMRSNWYTVRVSSDDSIFILVRVLCVFDRVFRSYDDVVRLCGYQESVIVDRSISCKYHSIGLHVYSMDSQSIGQ